MNTDIEHAVTEHAGPGRPKTDTPPARPARPAEIHIQLPSTQADTSGNAVADALHSATPSTFYDHE